MENYPIPHYDLGDAMPEWHKKFICSILNSLNQANQEYETIDENAPEDVLGKKLRESIGKMMKACDHSKADLSSRLDFTVKETHELLKSFVEKNCEGIFAVSGVRPNYIVLPPEIMAIIECADEQIVEKLKDHKTSFWSSTVPCPTKFEASQWLGLDIIKDVVMTRSFMFLGHRSDLIDSTCKMYRRLEFRCFE